MQQLTPPIIIEGDQDGYYVTWPSLQGCYSQGETYEEAIANVKDASRLHVEDRLADGEGIPPLHTSKILHPKVLKSILRDADLSPEDLEKLL